MMIIAPSRVFYREPIQNSTSHSYMVLYICDIPTFLLLIVAFIPRESLYIYNIYEMFNLYKRSREGVDTYRKIINRVSSRYQTKFGIETVGSH